MHVFTGQNRSEREKHVPAVGPAGCTLSPLQHLLEDMPHGEAKHHPDALREVFLALQNGWNKDRDLVKQELTQFGFCSHYGVQYSQFSSLMVQKENNSPEFLHSRKGNSALISYSCGYKFSSNVHIFSKTVVQDCFSPVSLIYLFI